MAKEKIICSNCGRKVLYEAKRLGSPEVSCGICKKITPVAARAVAKFVRTAPRKLRLVADLVRGKKVKDALALLKFTPKQAARVLLKVVESAKANAENTYQMDSERLVISGIYVDGGPSLKRFMPRAMGRAAGIKKRSSHITVKLEQKAGSGAIQPKEERSSDRKKRALASKKGAKKADVKKTKIGAADGTKS
jgi:large subunit ribosomal protein L22